MIEEYYAQEIDNGLPNLCWGIYRDEGSLAEKDTLILLTSEDEVYLILEKLNQGE